MNVRASTNSYRTIDSALLRASAHLADVVPAWWPAEEEDTVNLSGQSAERWCVWLREAWGRDGVADAVRTASPALADRVSAVCGGAPSDVVRVRRLALALARYLVRMRGRATPFGLFAGVASVRFGRDVKVRWSDRHRLRVRPDAVWLDTTLRRLESVPEVRRHLTVVRNDLVMVRGDRLLVPLAAETNVGGRAELSLRHSAAVRLVLELTDAPVPVPVLVDKLVAASSAGDGSAVRTYRAALQPDVPYRVATVPRDSIVVSLLHLHHVRSLGPDPDREALCHRLARSVALAALVNDPSAEDLA